MSHGVRSRPTMLRKQVTRPGRSRKPAPAKSLVRRRIRVFAPYRGDQRRRGRLADATIWLAGLSDADLSGCPTSRMGRRARSEPPSDAPWRLPMTALAPERERVPPFVKSVSTSTKPDQLVAPPRTSRRTLADLVKGGRSRLSFPFR